MPQKTRNPRYYRLDFIAENTFNRVWSIRMTRARVILVSIASMSAVCALIWVIMAFTPLRQLFPGALKGDLRAAYLETAVKLDSLEQASKKNQAYIANLIAVMKDEINPDSVTSVVLPADTLLGSSDTERLFVEKYREEERFNLSVLAPIAAEGMVFYTPVNGSVDIVPNTGKDALSIRTGRIIPISSVCRGSVVAVDALPDGLFSITIQHPNDFISIYSGLGEIFVNKGSKVLPGQRIAHSSSTSDAIFELWHNGSALDAREYIAF